MIKRGKFNVIMDGQWGSTGKGKLAGYIHSHYPEINMAVVDFMPNAGHTYIDNDGKKHIFKMLPVGVLFDNVKKIVIGPHAVIDADQFKKELEDSIPPDTPPELIKHRINIHSLATVVTAEDRHIENRDLRHIASTMQGSSISIIGKISRGASKVTLAREHPLTKGFVCDTYEVVNEAVSRGMTVLAETAQGFDLGLNNGFRWPYTTSRDCMVGRVLDNAGVSPKHLGSIIASLRVYPIRVGNIEGGTSGPCYDDQKEVDWEFISSNINMQVVERTTVTNRIRRVFTFSFIQLKRFCTMVRPDYAFLNFVNYLSEENDIRQNFVDQISDELEGFGCHLVLLGTGPGNEDVLEIPVPNPFPNNEDLEDEEKEDE